MSYSFTVTSPDASPIQILVPVLRYSALCSINISHNQASTLIDNQTSTYNKHITTIFSFLPLDFKFQFFNILNIHI